jgi:XTP/dITP diphosphohydrolase
MEITKIIIASGNKHKIEEIKSIFKDVEIISMTDAGFKGDIEENGTSFKENAYIKAKTVCNKLKAPVLADDSGLCVDALGGAPGIFSARFSGGGDEENRKLLLKRLDGISDRGAHFECAVC